MFSKFLGSVKKQRKLHSWRSSALGHAINNHTRNYKRSWKNLKKEDKEQLAANLNARIFSVLDSSSPIVSCRKELTTNVTAFADLQVLCLTEEEKEKNSLYKDMKLVSADLHNYIYSCAACNDELTKYVNEHDDIQEHDLVTLANDRCNSYFYYADGFDIVRRNIEVVKERDWFQPFVLSSMVVSESNYRIYIGLPAIATAIDTSFHSAFIDLVLSGEQDPLLSWERRYAKLHSASV